MIFIASSVSIASSVLVNMISSGLYDVSKDKLREAIVGVFNKANDNFGLSLYGAMEKLPSKEIQTELAKCIAKYMVEDIEFANIIKNAINMHKSELEKSIETEKDIKEKGYKLMFLSDCYSFSEEDSDKALSTLESALNIFKKSNNKYGEGQVLVKIGNIYNIRELDEKAKECYDNALKILSEMNDGGAYWRAAINNNIGNIFAKSEMYDKAEEKYNEALMVNEELLQSEALLNLGNIYRRQRKFKEAIAIYEKSKSNIRGKSDTVGLLIEKMACIGLANTYLEMEPPRFFEAIKYYENGYQVMERLDNVRGMCIAQMNIGTIYYRRKEFEQADRVLIESINKAMKIKDRILECVIQMSRGNVFRGMKKYDESLKSYEMALENYNKNIKPTGLRFVDDDALSSKMPSLASQLLGNIGNIFLDTKDFIKAIDSYERALTMVKGIENDYLKVHLLMNLGVAHCNRGKEDDARKALDYWNQALKLMPKRDIEMPEYKLIHEWIGRLSGRL